MSVNCKAVEIPDVQKKHHIEQITKKTMDGYNKSVFTSYHGAHQRTLNTSVS